MGPPLCWSSILAPVRVTTGFAIVERLRLRLLLEFGFADAAESLPAIGWEAPRLISGCACVSSAPTSPSA